MKYVFWEVRKIDYLVVLLLFGLKYCVYFYENLAIFIIINNIN